ncbi:2Fe-2S iron-sulfur cluster-binding protein [Radicibacter daui]|uniref:2Fe-2S iron-sulfur cluster-binding protein n=1 Tax=Radicibacter daui TaxID=3064829 RepID=UPI004046D803
MNSLPFRRYRVSAIHEESSTIRSFELVPAEGGSLPAFAPGQFLVLRLPAGQNGEFVMRNYSLCCPQGSDSLRIAVKHEGPPSDAPHLPPGCGSSWLHERVTIGSTLEATGPRGDFILQSDNRRPVVLIAGGVGATPLLAMFHALASEPEATARKAWFIHAAETGSVHAFGGEVRRLAASRSGLSCHIRYRSPAPEDLEAGRCDSTGTVDRALLQSLLPLDDYEVYLCGPPAFMKAVHAALRGLGIERARIHTEFFGPTTLLEEAEEKAPAPVDAALASAPETEPESCQVRFTRSGKTALWQEGTHSLLDLAEQVGINANFSCRAGVCGMCLTRLVKGEVRYFEEPLEPPEAGTLLVCCSRPAGPVEIEL